MRIIICIIALIALANVHAGNKLNVLFIAIDDLRPDIGCYGNSEVKTPNMDRLGSEGVVFERAYCQQAVCLVSRMSLMSGLNPVNGTMWNLESKHARNEEARKAARRKTVTLTEQFRRHGYRTIGLGKIYDHRQTLPTKDVWDSYQNGWAKGGEYASAKANQQAKEFRKAKAKGKILQLSRPATECADVSDERFSDGYKAKLAIKVINEYDFHSKPLFLAVGFTKPHLPFVAPKRYWDLYDRASLTLAPRRTPPEGCTPYLFSEYKEIDSYAHPVPMTEAFERQLLHGYYACASYVDTQLGKVIAALKKKRVYDKTIIVLWGDHGFKLGDFGEWAKHTNLETDTRVPLIIRLPGGKHGGQKTRALVELSDLLPTLCEAAGLPIPDSAQGQSLLPIITGRKASIRNIALSQYSKPNGHMGYSIRTEKWRYHEVRHRKTGRVAARELYDLSQSLTEQKNVIADHPEVADKLAGWLDARLKSLSAGGRGNR